MNLPIIRQSSRKSLALGSAMIEKSQSFVLPSVYTQELIDGVSYTYYTPVSLLCACVGNNHGAEEQQMAQGPPCVLGVDEAGRGPVIGPMVYGAVYLPIELEHSLLTSTHHFNDSKALTAGFRTMLMKILCTPGTDLNETCGWAVKSLSARDIGAGMLKHAGSYNLNAQAVDATIEIIRGVVERGVNIQKVYIDTIGSPSVYQKKLERIFPNMRIRVEKKADSLFPCVSAASVVAKVTRDMSCEVLYHSLADNEGWGAATDDFGWGSGYPSDARCILWLQENLDILFGWGNETRFSWGTVKEMMDLRAGQGGLVEWSNNAANGNARLLQFFSGHHVSECLGDGYELRSWYGSRTGPEWF